MSLLVLLLTALPALPTPAAPSTPGAAAALPAQDLKAEYEQRRAAAEGDVKKLWELVAWCETNGLDKERKSCLREIVKLDDNDKAAHEALGHVFYDGKWFTTEEKLAEHKKKEAAKLAKEQGLVPYKDGFAHPDDIPYLDKGLVKDAEGKWVDAEHLKHIQEGWKLQDLTWIPPAEFENIDKGLWKCGDEWKTLEEANAYHSEIGRWWRIPGLYFHLYTTLPRDVALQALTEIDRTFTDLTRIYGVEPKEPLMVVLLRSTEQYGIFAAGNEQWPGTDALGLSSVHGAFFADGLIDTDSKTWMGCGAGYWDPSTKDSTQFGKLFARHAAGQSFGERMDPSPKTLAKYQVPFDLRKFVEDFYAEKKVPGWFRIGAASFVERYYVDQFTGQGGDPMWARKWSIENVARRGGLDGMSQIFEMKIGPDMTDSDKRMSEAGLVMAFILDGDCEPVKKEHEAVKAAFKAGQDPGPAIKKLEAAVDKNADKLRAFANL